MEASSLTLNYIVIGIEIFPEESMKKAVRNTLVVFVSILVLGGIAALAASRGLSEIQAMTVIEPDLIALADGVYAGEFNKYRWHYSVEVRMEDKRISDIAVLKQPDGRAELAAAAVEEIIRTQKLNIDAVSGATVDTRALQKAVEAALLDE
jgi:uncharacterized protein with FMN-binding domain